MKISAKKKKPIYLSILRIEWDKKNSDLHCNVQKCQKVAAKQPDSMQAKLETVVNLP